MITYEKSFEDSISGSELVNRGLDFVEIAIDKLLNDGLLKEVPAVSTMYTLIKTGNNIKDAIYIKKLLLFIHGVQEVSEEERAKYLKEIFREKNRLIEKILNTIDKIDDSEKAVLLAKAFKHLIVGNINLLKYYSIARVIEDMMLDEINYFFYEFGRYVHTDESREKYYEYLEKIKHDDLISTMIRNGLYETKVELVFNEHTRPKQYSLKKTEGLTTLGKIFAELGTEGVFYLVNSIE